MAGAAGLTAAPMTVTRLAIWVWPLTRRNERWASIMPVAIYRFFMSPSFQILTRPVTTRTVEIIDSMQFVFVNDRRSAPVMPSRATGR